MKRALDSEDLTVILEVVHYLNRRFSGFGSLVNLNDIQVYLEFELTCLISEEMENYKNSLN